MDGVEKEGRKGSRWVEDAIETGDKVGAGAGTGDGVRLEAGGGDGVWY